MLRWPKRTSPSYSENSDKHLWDQLLLVIDFVKYADVKLAAVLASSSVVSGALLAYVNPQRLTLASEISLVTGIVLCVSAALGATWGILPRLRSGAAGGLLYFGDVARFRQQVDFSTAVDKHIQRPRDWRREVAAQVWINSRIAARKHRLAALSLLLLIAGLSSAALAVILDIFAS